MHGESVGNYKGNIKEMQHIQNIYSAHTNFIDPTGGRWPKAAAPCFVNFIGMCWISVLYMLYFLDIPYIIPYRFPMYFLWIPMSPYLEPGAIQLARSGALIISVDK